MKFLLCSLTLAVCSCVAFTAQAQAWWKTAIFYQVYPWSFKDSSNDGIGDLKGINSKVDYIAELGVDAIWMNPIYPSPMLDMGYDISDYVNIDYRFGNLTDFKDLVDALHAKDIKILLDFVPNHSSDQHPWFKSSVNSEGNYTSYYVWRDAKILENGTKTYPNNWGNGRDWEWNEKRQQYYLHQFQAQQPDLNFRDNNVRREMLEILQFWMDQGADGFRLDAVMDLVEDEQFRDEPERNGTDENPFDTNSSYMSNQNLSYVILREWGELVKAQVAKDGKERVLLSEIMGGTQMELSYTGQSDQPFSLPFNFDLINVFNDEGVQAMSVVSSVENWMKLMPNYSTPNWQVGNHDRGRIASRVGTEMVDSVNMILAMLPGIMVTYYGEELGMEDIYVSQEQQGPPRAATQMVISSREKGRNPFQWDDTLNAGFSESGDTWMKINPNYWWLNAAQQKAAEKSHLKVYQNLMKLRKSETFLSLSTQYKVIAPDNNTLGILRWTDKEVKYLLIVNFGIGMISPLTSSFLSSFSLQNVTQFTVTIASMNADYNVGDIIKVSQGVTLRPKSAVVLQTGTGQQSSASSITLSQSVLSVYVFFIVINASF